MKKLLSVFAFLFIITVLFLMNTAPSYSGTMKFVQLSDIHYSENQEDERFYKLLSKSKLLLQDAINQINNQKNIKFVMITGDGIDEPNEKYLHQLIESMNTLKFPWYYALGNHDTNPDSYISKNNFVKILKEKNNNYTSDVPYYTFKPQKGFRVVVIDAAQEKDFWHANGVIPKDELLWLDKILEESKNDVVLIFLHFPLVPPFDEPGHEILNADEFKAVLKKYDMPIAIFSGHYHAVKITQDNNIIHVSSPALVSYPNAFRIIEINNKNNEAVFKINFIETGLKDVEAEAKTRYEDPSFYSGKESDRNTVITIQKKK